MLQFHFKECYLIINPIYLGPVTYRLPRWLDGKRICLYPGDIRHVVQSLDWKIHWVKWQPTPSIRYGENSMDRGKRATVHGDTKIKHGQTRTRARSNIWAFRIFLLSQINTLFVVMNTGSCNPIKRNRP